MVLFATTKQAVKQSPVSFAARSSRTVVQKYFTDNLLVGCPSDGDSARDHNSAFLSIHTRSFSIYSSVSPLLKTNLSTFRQMRIDNGVGKIHRHNFSSKADFYDTLNVPKSADKGTIKKAYFKMAKQYHPDTNKGDEKAAEKFKEVTEAYEVLSDDKQRELYDTYGHAGVDPNSGFNQHGGPFGGGGNPFGGGPGGFDFGDGSFHFHSGGGQVDPEELFDAFFGGGRRRQRGPRPGADLQMHINLPFMDAVFGTKRDLNVRYQVRDSSNGRTEVKERTVECSIPAGIDSGMNLRLSGQGAEGDPGAPRGDLMVTVIVEEDKDKYFQRDGVDVHVEIPISVSQAILGGTVDVKTLTGIVEMKVPKGCQPDTKLMMRGKGIPYLRSQQKGNQIVHLQIQIPKKITERQEELLREFDKETEKSGRGISGRLAEAAGSAFQSFFGGGKSCVEKRGEDEKGPGSTEDKTYENANGECDKKEQSA